MTVELQDTPARGSVPIHLTTAALCKEHAGRLGPPQRRWLAACGFEGKAASHALVPGADGALGEVWAGVRDAADPWALAALPKALPAGHYHLGDAGLAGDAAAAAMSWELGAYQFDLYKPRPREAARLLLPTSDAARRGLLLATAIAATRDLVNTPAEHMGPAELAEAVRLVARQHKARVRVVVGDALLREGFPAVHAVGRAAARAPRLVELTWGRARDPLLVLVGKGVCFDSGGLDLKSAEGMRLMKKDMGGAANALGLAQLIMALALPVRLQLLIPAVENAVAGNAFRPGDIFKTRAGVHIEIGNTDAEGRVILCDALAYAAEGQPDLIIDLATLTGAARTALGPALPALFCREMAMARELVDLGLELGDPLWHLPLWRDYHGLIESDVADIVNTGRGAMAGAVTAALFLADFVPDELPWLHIDLFAWNDSARPGRPVGGEAQALRTLLAWLERRYRRG
ncbi:MAG: leucyl aminopeptidase family protein [Burkholderiaceae bacterium]|nr:leucyl aminopeptidase family protein [Burkholderiaceae bacterium]